MNKTRFLVFDFKFPKYLRLLSNKMDKELDNPEDDLFVEQESGPFWMVIKNKELYRSQRLTMIDDQTVKFIGDTYHNYDAQTEKDKLWLFYAHQGAARIVNFQSKKYLRVRIQDGEAIGLLCTDFEEEKETEFLWNVELSLKYRGFAIDSLYTDKNGKKLSIRRGNHANDEIQDEKEKYNSLVLFPERQFKVSKTGIMEYSQTMKFQKLIEKRRKQKEITEQQYSKLKNVIPNFSGLAFKSDSPFYRESTNQYASSSYSEDKMSPFMVCYPHSVQDVKAALLYAVKGNKKVVGRSGGHQYSGKSSGGKDTLVIDMGAQNFQQITERGTDLIDVGPSVRLKVLSKFLDSKGYSVPHGQCPLVCIGGHGQTGGYGNLLRSFGLNGDYIEGFQIVTTDGKEAKVYELTRPGSKLLKRSQNISQEFNNKYFTGVLSGNAGSFGIITRYTYKFIRDTDHKHSRGFKLTRSFNKQLLKKLLKKYAEWTKIIKEEKDEDSLKGLDFFLSLGSRAFPSWFNSEFKFSPMLGQFLYADLDNKPYADQFKEIEDIFNENITPAEKKVAAFIGGLTGGSSSAQFSSVSKLARSSVRKWPSVTYDGREYFQAYKKRCNLTCDVMSDEFIEKYADMIEQISREGKVKVVSQMQAGGGQYRAKGRELQKQGFVTYPHRDFTFCFTLDFFYSKKQMKKAEECQERFQKLVDEHFNKGHEKRFFWATFGNTDITDPTIRNMYYDNEDQYKKLQELKALVDPTDLFHTDLTVKLPGTPDLVK